MACAAKARKWSTTPTIVPELVGYAGLWHRANGAIAAQRLLDDDVEFDALFAFNDTLALGAMRTLQEAGVRVPEDVAVLGFDDLDEAQYSLPGLTTIDPGVPQIVESAVGLLEERMTAPRDDGLPPRTVYADFRVVERGSTARLL